MTPQSEKFSPRFRRFPQLLAAKVKADFAQVTGDNQIEGIRVPAGVFEMLMDGVSAAGAIAAPMFNGSRTEIDYFAEGYGGDFWPGRS